VEYGATPYAGDSYPREWVHTLDRVRELGAEKMVPGRGEALTDRAAVDEAIALTQEFVRTLAQTVAAGVADDLPLKQVFDKTRAALEPRFGRW